MYQRGFVMLKKEIAKHKRDMVITRQRARTTYKVLPYVPMTIAKTGLCDPAFSVGEAISRVLDGVRSSPAILRLLRRRASQLPFMESQWSHVNAACYCRLIAARDIEPQNNKARYFPFFRHHLTTR